ncbi:MAG: LytR C-terminal domain-containing protein [Actinomycetota bacterium]|nr:LytR C-terminal domain-containing protein [Actinomycetota bacterium]
MSEHHQAPDLLDELLGLDEPSSTEDEPVEKAQEASEEQKPRRRWWRRSKRGTDPPDSSETEPELPGQPAEPGAAAEPAVAAESVEEDRAGLQEQLAEDVAEAEPESDSDETIPPRRSWLRRRRTSPNQAVEVTPEPPKEPAEPGAATGGTEQSAEEPGDLPTDEVVEAPVSKRRGGRHLRGPGDEADPNDSADDPSTSSSGRGGSVLPPTPGPRAAGRARRRSRNRLLVGAGGALLVVAAVATFWTPSFRDDPQPERTGSAVAPDALADPVTTVLLYGTDEEQATEAAWMTLLSLNSETGESSVVYVPAHTATEVPGRGLLGIGESLASGPSLLEVSTETLLGVPVDERLQLTPEGALGLFQGVGDVSVDVPSELRVSAGEGQVQLLFPQGPQQLGPDELVSLLFRPGVESDDAELGGRHLAFWNGVLNQYADDPEVLAGAVAEAETLLSAGATTERFGSFLSELAQQPPSSRTLANLPVKEVSVGGDQLYETDPEELSAFVGETIGETDLAADLSRVQVLNGNGVPGIGVEVAEELVGNGFQITLSGNADRLDYHSTRIVSYDSSPEGIAVARQARALLGTGKVQVSSQGQGIVDLTIVVGRDFLRTR